jgi:hypothetical protein
MNCGILNRWLSELILDSFATVSASKVSSSPMRTFRPLLAALLSVLLAFAVRGFFGAGAVSSASAATAFFLALGVALGFFGASYSASSPSSSSLPSDSEAAPSSSSSPRLRLPALSNELVASGGVFQHATEILVSTFINIRALNGWAFLRSR